MTLQHFKSNPECIPHIQRRIVFKAPGLYGHYIDDAYVVRSLFANTLESPLFAYVSGVWYGSEISSLSMFRRHYKPKGCHITWLPHRDITRLINHSTKRRIHHV